MDPKRIALSATPPEHEIRRAAVCGYDGFGRHSRAPNLLALSLSADAAVAARAAAPPPSAGRGCLYNQSSAASGGGGANYSSLLYPSGRLAVLLDPVTGEQRCYDGHTQLVTAIAMHPAGTKVATAQLGSSLEKTDAYASIWS